jgi:hypothetical protein
MPDTLVRAAMGDSLVMPCNTTQARIVPRAKFSWQIVLNRVTDKGGRELQLGRRIQVDENGTLYIASVRNSDQQSGWYYRCRLVNVENNDAEFFTSYTKVTVTPATGQPSAIRLLYSSPSPVLGLVGQPAILRCFFSGRNDIIIAWTKADGSALTDGRFKIDTVMNSGRLLIDPVQQTDEGEYTCSTTNPPSTTKTVRLQVEAVPYFKNTVDGPRDINVTVGDKVTIPCSATAVPAADIAWYRNGARIDYNVLPQKFAVSDDRKSLTISQLCKDCKDEGGLGVIQCTATNKHGSVLGQGYVNVLDRTIITEPPPKNVELKWPDPVHFSCIANTDVATPLTYTWTHDGVEKYDGLLNRTIPGHLYIDIKDLSDQGIQYEGAWQCIASNGVSNATAPVSLRRPCPNK